MGLNYWLKSAWVLNSEGQVWLQGQQLITTNQDRYSCILLYYITLLVFSHIVRIPNNASSYNPLLNSQLSSNSKM